MGVALWLHSPCNGGIPDRADWFGKLPGSQLAWVDALDTPGSNFALSGSPAPLCCDRGLLTGFYCLPGSCAALFSESRGKCFIHVLGPLGFPGNHAGVSFQEQTAKTIPSLARKVAIVEEPCAAATVSLLRFLRGQRVGSGSHRGTARPLRPEGLAASPRRLTAHRSLPHRSPPSKNSLIATLHCSYN